jgi:hypothetical protein
LDRARASVEAIGPGFYSKLNEHLAAMDFARQIWALCGPAYREESRGGRPGIDPVVYFKMLMVGFFENLRSERAIAARCEDSLSVRGFLGYGLEESTPDHSSLSVIRHRLGPEIYQGVFEVVLLALKAHGLLKGRHLGIDSSVPFDALLSAMEAGVIEFHTQPLLRAGFSRFCRSPSPLRIGEGKVSMLA